jgi:hypothetical protein
MELSNKVQRASHMNVTCIVTAFGVMDDLFRAYGHTDLI